MVKASLLLMALLTLLIGMVLRWRQERMASATPQLKSRKRPGLLARSKVGLDRWVTAAAIAVIVTLALMGGLHWVRLWVE